MQSKAGRLAVFDEKVPLLSLGAPARMGDVLAELEDILRSKPGKDRITDGEEQVLQTCKARAIRDFTVGACVSSAVVWIASRSFTPGHRFNFSVGSAMLSGMWRFNHSLESCLDRILGLEGSRMQRELAHIILTKHQYNSSRTRLVRKHFYPEQVFSDMNPDRPLFRWRSRNFCVDGNSVHKNEDSEGGVYHENPDAQPEQLTRSPGFDMIVDPFDCIFKDPESSKEISHSDIRSMRSTRQVRAHKRAPRNHYHRARHDDVPGLAA